MVVVVFFVYTVAHEINQTLAKITKIFKHLIIYYNNKSKYSVESVSTLIICIFKMVILAIYRFFTKYEYELFMINIRTLSWAIVYDNWSDNHGMEKIVLILGFKCSVGKLRMPWSVWLVLRKDTCDSLVAYINLFRCFARPVGTEDSRLERSFSSRCVDDKLAIYSLKPLDLGHSMPGYILVCQTW